jgi:Family of unknown function (DUF5715)
MKIEVIRTSTLLPSVRPVLLALLLCPAGWTMQAEKTATTKVERPVAAVVPVRHAKTHSTQAKTVPPAKTAAPAKEHAAAPVSKRKRAEKLTAADFLKAAQRATADKAARAKKIAADKAAGAKTVDEAAVRMPAMPTLYDRRGRLIVPKALKGSHEILVHQNTVADDEGLDRIQNDEDLQSMREKKLLVALPESSALRTDERLPENRRYARPWTAKFLADMARAHFVQFHRPLQVNSAVRTVDFQLKLIRVNGNAAPADGDTASPHLTGQAVDIAKHELSKAEIAWMRGYLMPLISQGKVDVEEEFQQACFHVSVYRRYAPPATVAVPKRAIASRQHSGGSAKQATLVAALR